MATFKEVLQKAIERDLARIESVNQNLMQVSRSTKRKPNNMTIAVTDLTLENHLILGSKKKEAGFLLHIDGDALNAIRDELDGVKI